jgi:hypothetical protein
MTMTMMTGADEMGWDGLMRACAACGERGELVVVMRCCE